MEPPAMQHERILSRLIRIDELIGKP